MAYLHFFLIQFSVSNVNLILVSVGNVDCALCTILDCPEYYVNSSYGIS
jgi:hypothetical protein